MSNHITSIVSNKILGQVLYLVLFAFCLFLKMVDSFLDDF